MRWKGHAPLYHGHAPLYHARNFETLWFYFFVSLAMDSRVPSCPPHCSRKVTFRFTKYLWSTFYVINIVPGYFLCPINAFVPLQFKCQSFGFERACSWQPYPPSDSHSSNWLYMVYGKVPLTLATLLKFLFLLSEPMRTKTAMHIN